MWEVGDAASNVGIQLLDPFRSMQQVFPLFIVIVNLCQSLCSLWSACADRDIRSQKGWKSSIKEKKFAWVEFDWAIWEKDNDLKAIRILFAEKLIIDAVWYAFKRHANLSFSFPLTFGPGNFELIKFSWTHDQKRKISPIIWPCLISWPSSLSPLK